MPVAQQPVLRFDDPNTGILGASDESALPGINDEQFANASLFEKFGPTDALRGELNQQPARKDPEAARD